MTEIMRPLMISPLDSIQPSSTPVGLANWATQYIAQMKEVIVNVLIALFHSML